MRRLARLFEKKLDMFFMLVKSSYLGPHIDGFLKRNLTCALAAENLQCRKATVQEGRGSADNHQRPNSRCYHQKVADNSILPSYHHTSKSHVGINIFVLKFCYVWCPQKMTLISKKTFLGKYPC